MDLHIWDDQGRHASFEELDAIPGARLVEDIIPGFGPEQFLEDANPGRRYTFGVCVYGGGDVTAALCSGRWRRRACSPRLARRRRAIVVASAQPTGG